MIINSFSKRKRDESLTSLTATLVPMIKPKKIHVKSAAIGIKMLLVKKSRKSEIFIPSSFTVSHIPKPNDAHIPMRIPPIQVPIQIGIRRHPNWSWNTDTMVSTNEMEEVRAAKKIKIKKIAPITCPNGILINTLGKVTNKRLGPEFNAFGSPPEKAKTAGKTIRPDKNAIRVSQISILRTEDSIFSFLLKYEP